MYICKYVYYIYIVLWHILYRRCNTVFIAYIVPTWCSGGRLRRSTELIGEMGLATRKCCSFYHRLFGFPMVSRFFQFSSIFFLKILKTSMKCIDRRVYTELRAKKLSWSQICLFVCFFSDVVSSVSPATINGRRWWLILFASGPRHNKSKNWLSWQCCMPWGDGRLTRKNMFGCSNNKAMSVLKPKYFFSNSNFSDLSGWNEFSCRAYCEFNVLLAAFAAQISDFVD